MNTRFKTILTSPGRLYTLIPPHPAASPINLRYPITAIHLRSSSAIEGAADSSHDPVDCEHLWEASLAYLTCRTTETRSQHT